MHRVWLSLGSNINRATNIRSAVQVLRETFGDLVLSQVYESEAVGFKGRAFYNMVVGFKTERPPEELCRFFRALEAAHGRSRDHEKFASRTLDVDLLTYGAQIIHEGMVDVPRDEITQYAFVLLPLSEVAGDEVHPLSGSTYQALWAEFDAEGQALWPVALNFGLSSS